MYSIVTPINKNFLKQSTRKMINSHTNAVVEYSVPIKTSSTINVISTPGDLIRKLSKSTKFHNKFSKKSVENNTLTTKANQFYGKKVNKQDNKDKITDLIKEFKILEHKKQYEKGKFNEILEEKPSHLFLRSHMREAFKYVPSTKMKTDLATKNFGHQGFRSNPFNNPLASLRKPATTQRGIIDTKSRNVAQGFANEQTTQFIKIKDMISSKTNDIISKKSQRAFPIFQTDFSSEMFKSKLDNDIEMIQENIDYETKMFVSKAAEIMHPKKKVRIKSANMTKSVQLFKEKDMEYFRLENIYNTILGEGICEPFEYNQ